MIAQPLTWEELAKLYDQEKNPGMRPARTLPMDYVFSWAENQKDRFTVDVEGYIYLKDGH